MPARVNVDSSVHRMSLSKDVIYLTFSAYNYNNQIFMRVYPASMLSPVSDGMDMYHVHITNARHAGAFTHMSLISTILCCGFKMTNIITFSSVLKHYTVRLLFLARGATEIVL